ncbi:MAG: hypothetical protein P4L57_12605 [Rhizomicrobium sp.]|nr:hypothetical protein [Rhizomicrobium sp.]
MPLTPVNTPQERNGLRLTLAVTVGLLAIWGMALWLFNALFFKFAHFFAMQPIGIALTFAGFHLAYVLIAIPALLFHRKFGFKLGILLGLSVFGMAGFLLFLAMAQQESLYFLGAVAVIGACVAWLDSSLNPLAVKAGRPQTAVERLNFAHVFYGLGMFAGYYTAVFVLGPDYLLSKVTAAQAVRPYVLVGLGAILLAFVVEQITLPRFASAGCDNTSHWRDEARWLLQDKRFRFSAIALAAYSVVLSILWTANYRYNTHEMSSHLITVVERGSLWFVLGRICGVVLMRWLPPMLIMRAGSALCLLTVALSAVCGGGLGWVSLIACSFLLSIAYPTIFGTALSNNWSRMAVAAGLLVMASGIANAVAALCTSMALDVLVINPRLIVAAALPFQAIVVAYALKTGRSASRAENTFPTPVSALGVPTGLQQ